VKGIVVLLFLALVLACGGIGAPQPSRPSQPYIPLQVFEIKFDDGGGIELDHHVGVQGTPGWNGTLTFEYPFGVDKIFERPEELVNWRRKVSVEVAGCEAETSFDFQEDLTQALIEVRNASSKLDVEVRMHLSGMVEHVRPFSNPLVIGGGDRKRFSMVTAKASVGVNRTKVLVHLPVGQSIFNYLPTDNVTVLPMGGQREAISWSFEGQSAPEARIYVEFGTKGKIGVLMISILIFAVLGVILVVVKFFLILYEESLMY